MQNHAQSTPEPRKQWAAPQLKKIDIEEITANLLGGAPDGGIGS